METLGNSRNLHNSNGRQYTSGKLTFGPITLE